MVRKEADEARDFARKTVKAAESMGEQVRMMAEKMGTTGKSMSFEARAKARRNLVAQKAIADQLQAEADAASLLANQLKKKVQSQDPDDDNWLESLGNSVCLPLFFLCLVCNMNHFLLTICARQAPLSDEPRHGIKAWFIGAPMQSAGLGTIYYGCYDTSDTPPVKGWMPYSANAKWPAPTLKVTKGTITLWIASHAGENGANGS
jgi:hypothetical protein